MYWQRLQSLDTRSVVGYGGFLATKMARPIAHVSPSQSMKIDSLSMFRVSTLAARLGVTSSEALRRAVLAGYLELSAPLHAGERAIVTTPNGVESRQAYASLRDAQDALVAEPIPRRIRNR